MKLKMPMPASSPAAVWAGTPLSMQNGIRCVPISPLVLAPHTQKLSDSSQKSRETKPSPSEDIAEVNGFTGLGAGASWKPSGAP